MGFYAKKYNEIINAGGKFPISKEILEAKVKLILKEFTHSSDTDYDNPRFTSESGKDILSQPTVNAALDSSIELLTKADVKSDQEANVQHASQVLKMLAQLMVMQRRSAMFVDEKLYDKAHKIIEKLVEKVKENPKHPASNIVTTGEAWKQFFSHKTQESVYSLILMTMPLNDEDSLGATKDGGLYGVPNLDKIHLEDPVEGNKIISAMMMADNYVIPSSDVNEVACQAKEEVEKVVKSEETKSKEKTAGDKDSSKAKEEEIVWPKFVKEVRLSNEGSYNDTLKTIALVAGGALLGLAGYKAWQYFTDGTTTVTSVNFFED